MKMFNSPDAPAALGPYCHATFVSGMLFCSGQLGLDPKTGTLVEGIAAQTAQALSNLKAVLASGDFTPSNVVKTTVFLTDMNDFPAMNEVYEKFFNGHTPARSTVAVKTLPKNALVEIECIAVCG